MDVDRSKKDNYIQDMKKDKMEETKSNLKKTDTVRKPEYFVD